MGSWRGWGAGKHLNQDGDAEEVYQTFGACESHGVHEGLLQEERAADALRLCCRYRLCAWIFPPDPQPFYTGRKGRTPFRGQMLDLK